MKELMVDLSDIFKIKNFVNLSAKYTFNITLTSQKHSVSAKSIMGIFTLDISKPIKLTINTDDTENCNEYLNDIKHFVIHSAQNS